MAPQEYQTRSRTQSRLILASLLRDEPNNADYWTWMSRLVETQPESQFCMDQALQLDRSRWLSTSAASRPATLALPEPEPTGKLRGRRLSVREQSEAPAPEFQEEARFHSAQAAVRRGAWREAEAELARLLSANPRNPEYWLWMSLAVRVRFRRIHCLRRVLALDPLNPSATRGLAILEAASATSAAAKAMPQLAPSQRRTASPSTQSKLNFTAGRIRVDQRKLRRLTALGIATLAIFVVLPGQSTLAGLLPPLGSDGQPGGLLGADSAAELVPAQDAARSQGDEAALDKPETSMQGVDLPVSDPGGAAASQLPPSPVISGIAPALAYSLRSGLPQLAYSQLEDFDASWARINSYDWISTGHSASDFSISAQAAWESASKRANWWNSGCGFVFRLNARGDHYLALLALDGWVYLYRNLEGTVTRIGQGYFGELALPAGSAAIRLVAQGEQIDFYVNEVQALREEDGLFSTGMIGYALASGSNRDFGTRCRLDGVELTTLDPR